MHVGFCVKLAHHFAHEPINAAFHVNRHPTAFANFPVQAHNLCFRESRNPVPIFRNAGGIHAIHLFPLPLRVVFYERRLLCAVEHFEQAVQRHGESGNRPHNEMHRFDPAFGVSQFGGVLPRIMHLIQHFNRGIVLQERVVNQIARIIQQFLSAFGQLFARQNPPFMQIWEIQLDFLGIGIGIGIGIIGVVGIGRRCYC